MQGFSCKQCHYKSTGFIIIIIIVYDIKSTQFNTCVNPNMIFLLQSTNTKLSLILQYYNAYIKQLDTFNTFKFSFKLTKSS